MISGTPTIIPFILLHNGSMASFDQQNKAKNIVGSKPSCTLPQVMYLRDGYVFFAMKNIIYCKSLS